MPCPQSMLTLTLVAAAAAADPLGPGADAWSVEAPEAHGVASEQATALADYIMDNAKLTLRGCVVVIKDGALIHERYLSDKYKHTAHQAFSMTKSLGAMIAGKATEHGLDIDADITATYGVESPKPYAVTSRQIMSQSVAGPDGPGEQWAYDAAGGLWINHMIDVVNASTGMTSKQIWDKEIAPKMGLSDAFRWNPDKSWAAGSKGTCRDYARFGQLLLNDGRWSGAGQLLDKSYVSEMRTPQTRYEPYQNYSNPCYGLLTWISTTPGSNTGSQKYPGQCQFWPKDCWLPRASPADVYMLAGVGGQVTMVVPEHNMVVVSMGDTVYDYPLQRIMYEGICKIYPEDCAEAAVLV